MIGGWDYTPSSFNLVGTMLLSAYLSSVFDKSKTSYIPVNGHQVVLRQLITAEEAENKAKLEKLTELEKNEIAYVLGQNK